MIYDAKQDPVIPEYFGEYLESVHAEICRTSSTTREGQRGTDAR